MISKIIKIETVNDNIKIIRVKTENKVKFLPGQFMMLSLDGKVKRAFSITNIDSDDYLEFCIKKVENGKLSTRLFELKVGDQIIVEGSYGKFKYNENKNDVVFIAVGVGIAPLMSMIRSLVKKDSKNVTLVYGVRYFEDLAYLKELELLNSKGKIKFVKVLSKPESNWKYEKGHVQDVISKYIKGSEDFYFCGSKDMIDETSEKLVELGVDKKQINSEGWG